MKQYLTLLLLVFSIPAFADEKVDCEKAYTTIEVNICAMQEADRAFDKLEHYLAEARNRYAAEESVIGALNQSQKAWLTYRQSHCDAVYEQWSGGTIRGAMHATCLLRLNTLRTHVIWQDYLTYMDSTPPILPEPEL